jgi:hypothetical protein
MMTTGNIVRLDFDKLYTQTEKSFMVSIGGKEIWFPKSQCRKLVVNKKLGGWMLVTAWIYREKFGEEPSPELFDTVIRYHKPERVKPVEDNTINELKL